MGPAASKAAKDVEKLKQDPDPVIARLAKEYQKNPPRLTTMKTRKSRALIWLAMPPGFSGPRITLTSVPILKIMNRMSQAPVVCEP